MVDRPLLRSLSSEPQTYSRFNTSLASGAGAYDGKLSLMFLSVSSTNCTESAPPAQRSTEAGRAFRLPEDQNTIGAFACKPSGQSPEPQNIAVSLGVNFLLSNSSMGQ